MNSETGRLYADLDAATSKQLEEGSLLRQEQMLRPGLSEVEKLDAWRETCEERARAREAKLTDGARAALEAAGRGDPIIPIGEEAAQKLRLGERELERRSRRRRKRKARRN